MKYLLNTFKYILSLCCLYLLQIGCTKNSSVDIQGELKKWHKVTLEFNGPLTSEMDDFNPFLNYRLDVKFNNGDKVYLIPGYYAADGNAAESSADSGNKWKVHFTPDQTGTWNYAVSFKTGESIAVAEDSRQGESAKYMDGIEGSFTIGDTDKTGIDNRAKGRLDYIGEPYLKYAESGQYFIKVGVDAPENFLGYTDFDAATNVLGFLKTWDPHAIDYPQDAAPFLWKGDKGMNLTGAINYLASEGLNVFSFLTFNVDGDDRNIFPYLLNVSNEEYETYSGEKKNVEAWSTLFHKTRFDVSKLEQWERIFQFAETRGMFLHFKTMETETDHLMDNGVFGMEGKLYYRELIARFGHHLALNWNLGEENNQPIEELKKAANYIHKLDAYKHHLVVHTFPNQDYRFAELIGVQSPLTGASIQLNSTNFDDVHQRVLKWRHKSDSTGRRWAIAVDEPGSAKYALLPDDEDREHNEARGNALYGALFAGGYGVEWYFGYNSPNSDLTCQDFRSRDLFWDQNHYARHFFESHIPFWEMEPSDGLTTDSKSYCLALKDQVYLVYLPVGLETTSLDIGNSGSEFSIHWYNPRNGGDLISGSISGTSAKGAIHLGNPPKDPELDWLVLVKRKT